MAAMAAAAAILSYGATVTSGRCSTSAILKMYWPKTARTEARATAQAAMEKILYIDVPLGTVARDEESGEIEVEILKKDRKLSGSKAAGADWATQFCHTYQPGTRTLTTRRRRY
jgi:hypothetical protein